MKFVLAPDSFKESMTAVQAVAAMGRGIRSVCPDAEIVEAPMADGGEGTALTLVSALKGQMVSAVCHDAFGRPISASYGWVETRRLAIIEVAAACGLERVPPDLRDPRLATSYGVGEVVRDALDRGAGELVIGLGGSATNDAGAGMLTALGARFLDETGYELESGGAALARLARLDMTGFDPRLATVRVSIACDVTNPLLGASGASIVFGPQKGADERAVIELDLALRRWADIVEPELGVHVRDRVGAGAAGGLGAAWVAFVPQAVLLPGINLVIETARLSEALTGADYLFTGEGSFDAQTAGGKVVWGVAQAGLKNRVPVVVFAGRVSDTTEIPDGIIAVVPIGSGPTDLEVALAAGQRDLERTVRMVVQLLTA